MKLFAFSLREYDEKYYLEKICKDLNEDLVNGLNSGKIGFAALDTFENEQGLLYRWCRFWYGR